MCTSERPAHAPTFCTWWDFDMIASGINHRVRHRRGSQSPSLPLRRSKTNSRILTKFIKFTFFWVTWRRHVIKYYTLLSRATSASFKLTKRFSKYRAKQCHIRTQWHDTLSNSISFSWTAKERRIGSCVCVCAWVQLTKCQNERIIINIKREKDSHSINLVRRADSRVSSRVESGRPSCHCVSTLSKSPERRFFFCFFFFARLLLLLSWFRYHRWWLATFTASCMHMCLYVILLYNLNWCEHRVWAYTMIGHIVYGIPYTAPTSYIPFHSLLPTTDIHPYPFSDFYENESFLSV